ncbi:MAG: ATP-binding cassette domain-containing protein, partial [Phycisphaerae bacterium]
MGSESVGRALPAEIEGDLLSTMGQKQHRQRNIAWAKPAADDNGDVRWLTVAGARQNNLKNINVEIPLGRFVCVTGVSGSGKSSLVNDILRQQLARDLNGADKVEPGDHDDILGKEHLDKLVDIDQSPIGRTPRSNPAPYVKVFDLIRDLFSKMPDSKVRGYKPGRFSFNVPTGARGGGRCEACEGNGANKIEMDFLADIWVTCPVCQSHRFNRETLQIFFKGKTIANVLDMDVAQALEHFQSIPKIAHMLQTLHDVGLDYIKLGQSSTTLSGGEAQRIKLARELVKKSTGRTLYLLDEPTTGLHFDDIKRLLSVLHGFVDAGNTVLVVEHNLDVVKTADWIIDLGPEGGEEGGRIVAEGTPEDVAKSKASYTGQALRPVLTQGTKARRHEGTKGIPNRQSPIVNRQSSIVNPPPPRNASNKITVIGASQHNLKNINVSIPRRRSTVFSGPSGSGKTSLALDTIYAEGQRRYVESLSSYARQFLGQFQKPRVEHIEGLSPAIAIERKAASKSPRSTVGTVTEIYDFLRVLWARIGQPHCPQCKVPIGTQTSDEIIERILSLEEGARALLLAPIDRTGTESYEQLFERERANGFKRVRVDGDVRLLDQPIDIDHRSRHRVELVVDRLVIKRSQRSRIADSVEQALALGRGVIWIQTVPSPKRQRGVSYDSSTSNTADQSRDCQGAGKPADALPCAEYRFSQINSCDQCGTSYDELTPHHFSFNSRLGWCPSCEGLGTQRGAGIAAIVRRPSRSILDGALVGWEMARSNDMMSAALCAVAGHVGFDVATPWCELAESHQLSLLQGCGNDWIEMPSDTGRNGHRWSGLSFRWRGFYPAIDSATRSSWKYRRRLEDLVTEVPCTTCAGSRIKPESRFVELGGTRLEDVCRMPLDRALQFFKRLRLEKREKRVAGELLHEITSRIRFLLDVGLDYITLHRSAPTLSGGESQRIRLASQMGSGLTGVLYVLDEPTIGLHPRDNARLISALNKLRDLGNTLIIVEHDRAVIEHADHVIDFGPGAGADGGRIVAHASPKALRARRASLTGKYLSGKENIPVPSN